ncbi:Mdm33 family-domain-containing protein [Sporodiniella umbellata]|nr:Mdm33 family-domain-containing protein [Sporodiniella umbellata]
MPFRALTTRTVLSSRGFYSTLPECRESVEKVQRKVRHQLAVYRHKLHEASDKFKQLTQAHTSQEAVKKASRLLNEVTGYHEIEAVKEKVTRQSALFESTRDDVHQAKEEYSKAIETRSNTQRSINELLQRKHLWTAEDVTQFTELYRLEHAHTQAEVVAKERHQTSEKQMDREYMALARTIMERYHEEQLWSDKIRSASTYGTWALMGVNLLLFVAVQTVFEPRKRKKLTDRFEELLVLKLEAGEQKFKEVVDALDEKDRTLLQQQLVLLHTLNSLAEHPLFDAHFLYSLQSSLQDPLPSIAPDTPSPQAILPVIPNTPSPSLPWAHLTSAVAGSLLTAIAFYSMSKGHSSRFQIDIKSGQFPVIFSYHQLKKEGQKVPVTLSDDTTEDAFFKRLLEKAETYDVQESMEQEAVAEEEDGSDDESTTGHGGALKNDDYDFEDPFIDDSEMMLDDAVDYNLPHIDGFFVYQGPLDAGKPPAEEKKEPVQTGKRKAAAKAKSVSVPVPKAKARPKKEEVPLKAKAAPVMVKKGVEKAKTPPPTADPAPVDLEAMEEAKKKVTEPPILLPLDSELEGLLNGIKAQASQESFANKARFPEALKPQVLKGGLICFRRNTVLDANFIHHLMEVLPYNRYTLRKFVTTKSGQMRVDELQQEIDELAIRLKQVIDKLMPGQQQAHEVKVAALKQAKAVKVAAAAANNHGIIDVDALEPDEEITPKFKFNDEVRQIVYDIMKADEQSNFISNVISTYRNTGKDGDRPVADGQARKLMYQRLLSCWPDGWMLSHEIARQYNSYKKKMMEPSAGRQNNAEFKKRKKPDEDSGTKELGESGSRQSVIKVESLVNI